MIIIEEVLSEIFNQLPLVIDSNNSSFKVNFDWGTENALNLWISQKNQSTKYPLIWLLESETKTESLSSNKFEREIKLIIAKESNHKTNTNPIIWETEFKTILIPLAKNIITALEKSGITNFVNGYTFEQKANYYEGNNSKENYTIDCWNIIILKAKIIFKNNRCINKNIKF